MFGNVSACEADAIVWLEEPRVLWADDLVLEGLRFFPEATSAKDGVS